MQLAHFAKRKPTQLSGGQQQRVALARALVNRPRALLLDEPLGALDLRLRRQLQVELKRIQQDVGITFIHVTHDQEEAMSMADTIAVMNGGRIEQAGSAEELYEAPKTAFVANFLGTSNLIDAKLGAGQRRRARGRDPRRRDPARPGRPRRPARPTRCASACGRRSSSSTATAPNVIRGRVVLASFLGTVVQYVVRAQGRRGGHGHLPERRRRRSRRRHRRARRSSSSWDPQHTFVVGRE